MERYELLFIAENEGFVSEFKIFIMARTMGLAICDAKSLMRMMGQIWDKCHIIADDGTCRTINNPEIAVNP
jgi:hypothetical protein